jgi:hypothetical protein
MHDARTHVFENLFAAAERFFGTANHKGKGSSARSADTSGNRRVERETALLACKVMRTPCARHVDRGRIDDERPLGEMRQDPAVAQIKSRLGQAPEQIVVDAGYTSRQNILTTHDQNIELVGPWIEKVGRVRQRFATAGLSDDFLPAKFQYDAVGDVYICPQGKRLTAGQDRLVRPGRTLPDKTKGLCFLFQPRTMLLRQRTQWTLDRRNPRGSGSQCVPRPSGKPEDTSLAAGSRARGRTGKCMAEGKTRPATFPCPRLSKGHDRNTLGGADL